jgi:hypothetical protein
MVKRTKTESARRRRIGHAKTAVKHVKKLQTQLKGLSRHLTMMAQDNHSPGN